MLVTSVKVQMLVCYSLGLLYLKYMQALVYVSSSISLTLWRHVVFIFVDIFTSFSKTTLLLELDLLIYQVPTTKTIFYLATTSNSSLREECIFRG